MCEQHRLGAIVLVKGSRPPRHTSPDSPQPPKSSWLAGWFQPVAPATVMAAGVISAPAASRNWKWMPVHALYSSLHPSLIASAVE